MLSERGFGRLPALLGMLGLDVSLVSLPDSGWRCTDELVTILKNCRTLIPRIADGNARQLADIVFSQRRMRGESVMQEVASSLRALVVGGRACRTLVIMALSWLMDPREWYERAWRPKLSTFFDRDFRGAVAEYGVQPCDIVRGKMCRAARLSAARRWLVQSDQ